MTGYAAPDQIAAFLAEYSAMALVPSRGSATTLEGDFVFKAMTGDGMQVEHSFQMRIVIPPNAPKLLPAVKSWAGELRGSSTIMSPIKACFAWVHR